MPDIVLPTEFIPDVDLDLTDLQHYDIPEKRASQDTSVNNYGKRCIDMF